MVDDDLGAVDVVSAAGAVLAGGDRLEDVLALGQAVDPGDEQGVGVVALIQAELAHKFIVDVVSNIAHGPVLTGVDVDGIADEVDGIPDGFGVGGGVAGPGVVFVTAVPAGGGEGEIVAFTALLCVGDGGGDGFIRRAGAGDGAGQDHGKGQDQTQNALECAVFHRIPPSFFSRFWGRESMSSITIIDISVNSELGGLHKKGGIKLMGIPNGIFIFEWTQRNNNQKTVKFTVAFCDIMIYNTIVNHQSGR